MTKYANSRFHCPSQNSRLENVITQLISYMVTHMCDFGIGVGEFQNASPSKVVTFLYVGTYLCGFQLQVKLLKLNFITLQFNYYWNLGTFDF